MGSGGHILIEGSDQYFSIFNWAIRSLYVRWLTFKWVRYSSHCATEQELDLLLELFTLFRLYN